MYEGYIINGISLENIVWETWWGSSHGRSHCVVSLGKTLLYLHIPFYFGCINGYQQLLCWGNLAMDLHSIQGEKYTWHKLWRNGLLGLTTFLIAKLSMHFPQYHCHTLKPNINTHGIKHLHVPVSEVWNKIM